MGLGTTPKAMTLDNTLETFTFRGSDDVYRFAIIKQTCIKLCPQFNALCRCSILQSNFPEHFKWSKFGTSTTLAIFFYFEQLTDLLTRLLCRLGLAALFACLRLLILFVFTQA